MPAHLSKVYDPGITEEKWYAFWEREEFFRAEVREDKKSYCITIPPPNVTGSLHMGHAIQHAVHDMIIRWKRMQGCETLCLPGTDHAGIATQMVVENELARTEARTRHDLGRDAFLDRVWAWKETYGEAIYKQLRKLGASYDWQRARFTLDEAYVEGVLGAFEHFHSKGWIYRGTRMINWCPACRTVISDLETEERELQGNLWHIRYPGVNGGPEVVVVTTRPETLLGDTAVAVHPDDGRWRESLGKMVSLPLVGRRIPIIADGYADPEVGTGAVKVTPAHDPNDYEIGQRHGLEQIQVIGYDGISTEEAGAFRGMERYACRKAVVAALRQGGFLEDVEDHLHSVPHHDKCGTVIEPLPMEQWFMDMKPLARLALPYLESGAVSFIPDRFSAYSVEWLRNIRDWALSRQIWWGHRIPAWYCRSCSAPGLIPLEGLEWKEALDLGNFRVDLEKGARPMVSATRPDACSQCGSEELVQDPDVLDTWFSSALWPFATLGWPRKTADLRYFYPTDLMITGRDILYLWVLRMVMTAVEFLDEIPFKVVLVHPTVLTRDGRRMSKSLGTGLDPLDLIRLYGADATRYSLLHQVGTLQDVRFDAEMENSVVQSSVSAENGRNFCNKLWNAARFVLMNLEGYESTQDRVRSQDLADRWIESRFARTIEDVNRYLEAYRLSDVTRVVYDFLWRDYCDWFVEMAKARLQGGAPEARLQVQHTLIQVLEQALRLMHPIMPFITEALWQVLPASPGRGPSIMLAPWPAPDPSRIDDGAEEEVARMQNIVTAVRTMRADMNIPPGRRVNLLLATASPESASQLARQGDYIEFLSRAEKVEIGHGLSRPQASVSAIVGETEVYIPLEGLIDLDVERRRLQKEIAKYRGLLNGLEKKLGNSGFLQKAPREIVEKERERHAEYMVSLAKLEGNLEILRT